MAEQSEENEKSEDPTQKRLDEALERGDVAKSQEVSTWFVLAGATLVLMVFAGPMSSNLKATHRRPALQRAPDSRRRRRSARGCSVASASR